MYDWDLIPTIFKKCPRKWSFVMKTPADGASGPRNGATPMGDIPQDGTGVQDRVEPAPPAPPEPVEAVAEEAAVEEDEVVEDEEAVEEETEEELE